MSTVLKVYSIEPDGFVEACNMRGGKNQNLSYSSNDVAWSTIEHNLLATAATNGVISVWDLSKFGRQKQLYVFNEHERTAHTVTFHGTEPHLLISGSQDGTIKCFDLRCDKAVHTYCSNAESVRDVKFSPQQPHQFAAVSENGTVQLWDMKRPDRCQLQFTAHSGPVYTCDWHPTQPWLATGSRDRQIKVWRMDQKPALEYNIHTIAVVGRVKWRPERQHHIASCALVVDYSIYIWDVRRPYIPYASFTEHTNVTTGIAFKGNDPHVLMSASKDSTIFKHSFQDATRPTTKVNPQASCFNLNGDLLFAYKVKNVPGATGTTAPVPGELPASAGGALGGASGTGIAAGMAVSQSASMSASGNNSAASTCIGAVAAASAAAAVALPPSTPRSSGAGAFIADTISSVYSTPRAVSTAASAQSAAVIGQLPHEQFHLAKSRLLSYTADSWTNGSTTDATSHHNHHYHHQQQSQHHHPRPPAVSSSATGHHGHVGAIATVGMSHEFDAFRGCARDYILTGAQLSDICDYNADIARKYGKANVSMLWRFIGNQYANVALTYGGSGAGNAGSGAGVNADVTITQRNKSQAGCSNNGGTVVSGGIGSSPGGSNSIIAASSNANITGRLIHMLPGHNTNRQLSTATGALLATVTSTGSTVVGSGIASVATAGNTNSSTSTHAGSGVCQPESSSEQEVLVQMCCEDLKLQDFRHPKSGEFKHSSGTGGCSAAETTTNNSSSAHNTNDGSDGAQKTSIVTAVTPTVATASSAAAAAAEQELADQSADSLASFVHGDAEELTVHDVKGLRNGFLYIGPHDLTKGWSLPHNNLNELQTKKAAADMEAECRQQAEADGMVVSVFLVTHKYKN